MADTVRLHIPAAVFEHWEPKFDDLRQHGVTSQSDATYAKVLAAPGKRKVIDADAADLAEIAEECAFNLDDDTEVANGDEPEYRRFRAGYMRLRKSLAAFSAKAAEQEGRGPGRAPGSK